MARLASFIALLIGACAHTDMGDAPLAQSAGVTKVTPARIETVPFAYRPGEGVVESIARIESAGSAAAGGTAGRLLDRVGYRLAVRMDDGTLQTVLQDSSAFAVGDRVRLTEDGEVIRL